MIELVVKIWRLTDHETRRGLCWAALATLLLAGLEMLGIGLFVPMLSMLLDATTLEKLPLAKWALIHLADGNVTTLINRFCLALLVLFFIKTLAAAWIMYTQNRFLLRRQADFSGKLLRNYLERPYIFHLQHNSAELVRNVTVLCTRLFVRGVFPLLQMVAEVLAMIGVISILLWVDAKATLLMVAVLGSTSAAFYVGIRNHVASWGKRSVEYDREILQAANQALGSVKLSKLGGHEAYFSNAFVYPAIARASYLALSNTAPFLPRLFVEIAALATLLLLVVVLTADTVNTASALPVLAIFGVAGLRLMPSVTRLMTGATLLRENAAAVDILYRELRGGDELRGRDIGQAKLSGQAKVFAAAPEIRLEGVSFAYPGESSPAIENVNLVIPRGASVAIVGESGAGKTTLVDVMLGLLTPAAGHILVDGVDIRADLRGWQQRIGYIPQDVYLTDDTLAHNVALGMREEEIDRQRLAEVLDAVRLTSVMNALPDGVDTPVGERGNRLSGGQRQRVGIARALYIGADLLVMDEATSALDMETELEISKVIAASSGRRTTIIIAHRLATVRTCSQVAVMERGRIKAVGRYDELARANPGFSRMIELSDARPLATAP